MNDNDLEKLKHEEYYEKSGCGMICLIITVLVIVTVIMGVIYLFT